VLIGIELMLNAANLNFIAFWRYGAHPEALTGILFVLFSIGVAAAEAAIGLALIISIYRHYRTTNVDQIGSMNGNCSSVGQTSGLPVRGASGSVNLMASKLRAGGPANRQTGGLPHTPT
jgi:NADH-quinone oxidoreductase subunit K